MGSQLPLILACLSGVAIFAIVLGVAREYRARRVTPEDRLQRLIAQRRQLAQQLRADQPQQGRVAAAFDKLAENSSLAEKIADDLARAGISLTVGEYLVILALLFTGGGLISLWLHNWVIFALTLAAVTFGSRMWLAQRRTKRSRTIDRQLPEAITIIASSMRASGALNQALERTARESPAPIGIELQRALWEMHFGGSSLDDAFARMLMRCNSEDLQLLAEALVMQNTNGGDITMLERIADTIRERVNLHGEIQSLTAQQRYSAYVVTLMPVALAGFLFLVNPNYILDVFRTTTWCGWTMFGTATIMLLAGMFTIRRIVSITI